MTKRRIVCTTACVVSCLVGALFLSEDAPLAGAAVQASLIEDFDIILIAGRSFRSRIVRLFGGEADEWSHVGILYREDGRCFILHATPDTRDGNAVLLEPLDALFGRKAVSKCRVIRLAGLTPAQKNAIRRGFQKAQSEPHTFDYAFDTQEHSSIYCSELVLMVFSGIIRGVDIRRTVYPGVFGTLANSVTVLDYR